MSYYQTGGYQTSKNINNYGTSSNNYSERDYTSKNYDTPQRYKQMSFTFVAPYNQNQDQDNQQQENTIQPNNPYGSHYVTGGAYYTSPTAERTFKHQNNIYSFKNNSIKFQQIPVQTRIQYIPFQKTYIDNSKDVPTEITKTDYYGIEYLRQYIPSHIPEEPIQYVVRQKKVKKYDYIPVQKQIVHYPEQLLTNQIQQQKQQVKTSKKSNKITQKSKNAVIALQQQKKQKELNKVKPQKKDPTNQLKLLTQKNNNLQKINADLQKQLFEQIKIQEQYKKQKQSNNPQTLIKQSSKKALFLQSQILQDLPEKRQQLVSIVQFDEKHTIKKTKLIYKLDLQNPTNFHRYIDGHPNILLLVEMQNGNLLGAFCLGKFEQINRVSNEFGIIFSLTNNKQFKTSINNNSISLVYDKQHIVFGNSQLRIQTNSNTIFSNFGYMNRYYQSNGENVNVLLGQGQQVKQGKMKAYEIYRIQFQ